MGGDAAKECWVFSLSNCAVDSAQDVLADERFIGEVAVHLGQFRWRYLEHAALIPSR
jgi:hypothetical protein